MKIELTKAFAIQTIQEQHLFLAISKKIQGIGIRVNKANETQDRLISKLTTIKVFTQHLSKVLETNEFQFQSLMNKYLTWK